MKIRTIFSMIGLAMAVSIPAFAQDEAAGVLARLKEMYPSTQFTGIREAEVAGLYEVSMRGNIAYTDKSGRFFLFGHLWDMKEQLDVTAERKAEANKVDFDALPLKDAFKRVQGKGTRKLALFSDPDCPYCKRIEGELAKLTDITIYTFPFPLEQLHPDAKAKAVAMWCAKDQVKAWDDYMQSGKLPPMGVPCDNPVERNIALGNSMGINGTPTMILSNGRKLSGALPADQLEKAIQNAAAAKVSRATSGGN